LQRYTKEVRIVIAATAATPRTMDEKEIERRKWRRMIDDDDDNDDDDNDDDKDDYDEDEDKDNESSNDVDDDEVVDKSSNPPGINAPPPPAQGKAPSSSHERKNRSGSNFAIVPRGNKPLKIRKGTNPRNVPPHIRRGTNLQRRKRRANTSSPPPLGDLISCNSSSNTLGTYESPQFVSENIGPEAFSNDVTGNEYMCSYCQVEYSACSYDPHNPSLHFLYCEHRFCRDCIETIKGGQDCPVNDCRGKNDGIFQLDEELVRKVN